MQPTDLTVRRFATPSRLATQLALDLAHAAAEKPDIVLALPTGRTPVPVYAALVALYRSGRADFSRATAFNLDEFVGLPGSDSRSYRAFLSHHLFDHVNFDRRRRYFLNGAARDIGAECARYERRVASAGGIDLMLLGLGTNGHIGFNEPGATLSARTHRVRLAPSTRRANAALFGGRSTSVPREGLSMGMATILGARRIIVLAMGYDKAVPVRRLLEGPLTTSFPASLLHVHGNAEVWVDREAASALSGAS